MKLITRGGLVVCLLLFSLILGPSAPRTFGGKPAPPPNLPIHYYIQFFTPPGVFGSHKDFNNHSQSVGGFYTLTDGRSHGWFYDPHEFHYSQLDPSNDAIDLNEIGVVGVPPGWFIAEATGLNEDGLIVGRLEKIDDPNDTFRRGFVLNMKLDPPQLTALPDSFWTEDTDWTYTWPRDINNQGVVLGTFARPGGTWGMYLYDPTSDIQVRDLELIVQSTWRCRLSDSETTPAKFVSAFPDGTVFRYTDDGPQGSIQTFPQLTPLQGGTAALGNANQWGDFCGSGLSAPVKGKTTRRPIRVLPSGLQYLTVGDWARGVNVRGDLYTTGASSAPSGAALYWDTFGVFNINDLVVGTPADVRTWKSASFYKVNDINDPLDPLDPTDPPRRSDPLSFGELSGQLVRADGVTVYFYLTPVP